ncbi:hypothetical protein G6L09_11540 [Agrobacterium rhizogenes]|jgi:hypothetical protein|nr:hypothetical protein [Rhizobium rhizogenes]NTH71187.1 hypothetical protein [Rhizobium rhizogenes]
MLHRISVAAVFYIVCASSSVFAGSVPSEIVSKCAAEWGTDYRMQVYCREKQMDALRQLQEQDHDAPVAKRRHPLDNQLVIRAVKESKGILQKGSIPALVKAMNGCLKTMKTVSQFQRCSTFGSVLIFYRTQETGPASMEAILQASSRASTRVFGEAGDEMALQWVGTIGGIVTRELRGFPRTY